MINGPPVDPITGRPVAEARQKARADPVKDIRKLEAKAEFPAYLETKAGSKFRGLIMDRLMSRIEALIREDDEARAYVNLLTEVGHKKNIAKIATRKLAEKYGDI